MEADSKPVAKFQHELSTPDSGNVKTVDAPMLDQIAHTELYGLWNRFFPVKVVTRVLASMSKGDNGYIPLDFAQEKAADLARVLGRTIFNKERSLGRKRGDMIATALPWRRDEFKAKARFKTHFVGYINKNGIEGMPAALNLANIIKSSGTQMIGLTVAGLKFAILTNPVIDQEDYSSSLSQSERQFLLDLIKAKLPAEMQLMRSTLQLIANGTTSPTALQAELQKLKPNLNKAELSTLRCGLLGRIYELKLIRRYRDGLAITYEASPEGCNLLNGD